MSTKSRYTPTEYELPDEGWHRALVSKVEFKPDTKTAFGVKDMVRIWLKTDQRGEDGKYIPVSIYASDNFHSSASMPKIIRDLTGKTPEIGYDYDKLVGIKVDVFIEHQENERGTWPSVVKIRRKPSAKEEASDQRVQKAIDDAKNPPSRGTPTSKEAPEPEKSNRSKYNPDKKKSAGKDIEADDDSADDGPLFEEEEPSQRSEPEKDPTEISDEDVSY